MQYNELKDKSQGKNNIYLFFAYIINRIDSNTILF